MVNKIKFKRRITVRSAKNKGRNLQHYICRKISELLNISFDNEDDDSLILSRPMGQHGVDIILRGEALERFPYSVETKSSQSLSILTTIDQAKANEKQGTDWLLFYKRKEIKKPIVIMDSSIFFGILKKLEELKKYEKGDK